MLLKMKNNFYKNKKSFTLIECIFAIFILSIMSIYILYGINSFFKIQNLNVNDRNNITEIENTICIIRNNLKNGIDIFNNLDANKYNIDIKELRELYYIKISLKDNMEKFYEFYISKKS